jgi:hypothetical protein
VWGLGERAATKHLGPHTRICPVTVGALSNRGELEEKLKLEREKAWRVCVWVGGVREMEGGGERERNAYHSKAPNVARS